MWFQSRLEQIQESLEKRLLIKRQIQRRIERIQSELYVDDDEPVETKECESST